MSKYTDLIQEVKDNFQAGRTFWQDTRIEGQRDMRAVAGDPWDPDERAERENNKRPALSLDELSQYLNALVNGARQHPRAIKVSPKGDGANDQTAELRANKIREIEYRSNAKEIYTTSLLEQAAQRSYGFMRIKTEWESERSFNKDISIESIVNPDQVTVDPFALKPTSSDAEWMFVHETRRKSEFIAKYGKDAALPDLLGDASEKLWVPNENSVQVAEYWKKKYRKRVLLQIQPKGPQASGVFGLQQPAQLPPVELFEDEQVKKRIVGDILQQREVEYPSICQYLTNGAEILKETTFPGTYIPIVSCYGKVLYLDDGTGVKRHILSMIRLARDPYMLYCYYRTQQAEMAGMIPKAPVVGYKGQFRGEEVNWQKANHEPMAYLEANPYTEATGQQVLPLPTRMAYEAGPHLQALELCAEGARRAIQAAIGSSPLPTSAQRRNEKSGVALQRIEEAQQLGSFHFIDHYEDSIRQGGVIINSIFGEVFDTVRTLNVRKPDDSVAQIRVNDPTYTNDQGEREEIRTDEGDHDVTISTGANFDSERERADDFTTNLVQSPIVAQVAGPEVAAAVLAKSIKMMNLGPIGDEISDLILPAKYKKDAQQPDAAQLQQLLTEANQMLQMAQGKIQELEQAAEADLLKQKAETERAALKNETTVLIEQLKAETSTKLEEFAVLIQQMKDAAAMARQNDQQKHEVALKAVETAHADAQADTDMARGEFTAERGHERAKELQANEARE